MDMAGHVRHRVGPMIEQFRSRNGGEPEPIEPEVTETEELKEKPEVGVSS
jgi:hypothetical protein